MDECLLCHLKNTILIILCLFLRVIRSIKKSVRQPTVLMRYQISMKTLICCQSCLLDVSIFMLQIMMKDLGKQDQYDVYVIFLMGQENRNNLQNTSGSHRDTMPHGHPPSTVHCMIGRLPVKLSNVRAPDISKFSARSKTATHNRGHALNHIHLLTRYGFSCEIFLQTFSCRMQIFLKLNSHKIPTACTQRYVPTITHPLSYGYHANCTRASSLH